MKILFVYPRFPDTLWGFRHALKFVKKKAVSPPLPLLTVASMLPLEWEKCLVDENVQPLMDAYIEWADMVCVTAIMVQAESVQKVVDRCNKLKKKVVAGGPLFSAQPDLIKGVDYLVLNEAEITLPLFLNDLKIGKLQPVYTSNVKPSLSLTPAPMWELIDFRNYVSMSVQYSRGCPFECDFCDITALYGRVPRVKSPEQFVGEIESLYQAGWRGSVFIVDDNFIGNKLHVEQMLRLLINWQIIHNYPFQFITQASINLANEEELMALMSRANFHKIFVGIESPNRASLIECGKIQNTKLNLEEAIHVLNKNGMGAMVGLIVGFDKDDYTIFSKIKDFVLNSGIGITMLGLLQAPHGTELAHRLKNEGRLTGYISGDNVDMSINFIPKMPLKVLLDGYKELLLDIHSPRSFYRRMSIFIKHYRQTVRGRLLFANIMSFCRSVWYIGIFSPLCFRYWQLIVKTCVINIKALSAVIEELINAYHLLRHSREVAKK